MAAALMERSLQSAKWLFKQQPAFSERLSAGRLRVMAVHEDPDAKTIKFFGLQVSRGLPSRALAAGMHTV